MKIVVIGATGTIGKSVSKKLKENNHEVIEVGSKSGDYQLDITSPTELNKCIKILKI
nr:NAD-dependent epimerase/dehydratase family protein [Staphylococcus epidermidis]